MKSNQAQAAKLIKKELSQKFPNTKFKVTSQGYSMGNHVVIEWDDGPTQTAVRDIVSKYQYGHFDGMYDIYEYSNKRDDIPQTKFIILQRHVAKMIKQEKTP